MLIGVPREILAGERRVALVPERVAQLAGSGNEVLVERGAGDEAHYADDAYLAAGAQIVPNPQALYERAEMVLKVRAPSPTSSSGPDETDLLRAGTVLIALLDPLTAPDRMVRLAERKITAFSLESMPRITRAQSMDVLSSMSTVAGYRAALIGALNLGKFFPLLMTAAGTVTPARVLILGAGVAGLQAIATARRLGAVVQAFDTRPVVREQVESLGASFLSLPLAAEHAEDAGGYARQLTEAIYTKEREFLAEPVREADVIITTAMIPGAQAPLLITEEMLASMRPGSVIVDLAATAGGNTARTVPGERVEAHGVVIEAPTNLPATMPVHASQLFARNLLNFVNHLLASGLRRDAQTGVLDVNLEDEITGATCITHGGEIVNRAIRERAKAQKGGPWRDE